jgi:hypothetical protein
VAGIHKEVKAMRRSRITWLVLGLVLGAMLVAANAVANHPRAQIVRWDLVEAVNGVAVSGGENVATDQTTGDSLTLTGSGHVRPRSHEAFGGGTFVHEDVDGNEISSGSYHVIDFVSWKRLRGGDFGATGLIDGIGDPDEASSGILTVKIRARPEGSSSSIDALLEVHCNLPGTVNPTFEGVRVQVGGQTFEPDPERHGLTLFHVMR